MLITSAGWWSRYLVVKVVKIKTKIKQSCQEICTSKKRRLNRPKPRWRRRSSEWVEAQSPLKQWKFKEKSEFGRNAFLFITVYHFSILNRSVCLECFLYCMLLLHWKNIALHFVYNSVHHFHQILLFHVQWINQLWSLYSTGQFGYFGEELRFDWLFCCFGVVYVCFISFSFRFFYAW